MNTPHASDSQTEAMVVASGSYDFLKKRLSDLGEALQQKTQQLNHARQQEFGKTEQKLQQRIRARTENNCFACDIVRIGETLLFGYNVHLGLRREMAVEDVFALYRLALHDGQEELEALPLEGSLLADSHFLHDFKELFTYYKQAKLTRMRRVQDQLLITFRIGQQVKDIRVFRWAIKNNGQVEYVDNRGERDAPLPSAHSFEWQPTSRENHVGGRYPHINILDAVFVETTNGTLTVKIEDNTETGFGIYDEPVEDRNQALIDAEVFYAQISGLILLKIKPYRENDYRYLVYNPRTQQVQRIDAIGASCIGLPEDQGILFPGGYYLQSGESKRYSLPEHAELHLQLERTLRAPNGEDYLYAYIDPENDSYALLTYSLIDKTLATPILASGYALFEDGGLMTSPLAEADPTRIHTMQLWKTPFTSEEFAANLPRAHNFFGRIGNTELVRCIADLTGITRAVHSQTPTQLAYQDLIRQCQRLLDSCFWIREPETNGLSEAVQAVIEAAGATLKEFEKVDAIRRETARAIQQAQTVQTALLSEIASSLWKVPQDFVSALHRLREQRGQLISLRDLRYADLELLQQMDAALVEEQQRVGERALRFLAEPGAFDADQHQLQEIAQQLPLAETTSTIQELLQTLATTANALDILTEQLSDLPGGDAVMRTQILDQISAMYTEINRLRAHSRQQMRQIGSAELADEFGAQFKLFNQAIENAIDFADTPEKCDDALTRLLTQLETLEGKFAEQPAFMEEISQKREAVYEALSGRKQTLLDEQQRRCQTLQDAGQRILTGIPRRIAQMKELPQVHSYFAADALINKLRQIMQDLRDFGAQVMADDLDTQLRSAQDRAVRQIRDQGELISADGNSLRFGKHAFTVSRQSLDLTLVPRQEGGVPQLMFHLTGTDYFSPIHHSELDALQPYWNQTLISETESLYRAEYLAGCLLNAAQNGELEVDWLGLQSLCENDKGSPDKAEEKPLLKLVRHYIATRYQEGYQKGIHDTDAIAILKALVSMQSQAGLLTFSSAERTLALLFWQYGEQELHTELQRNASSTTKIARMFADYGPVRRLIQRVAPVLYEFKRQFQFHPVDATELVSAERAAEFLVRHLAMRNDESWPIAGGAEDMANAFRLTLERANQWTDFQQDLEQTSPTERWRLARNWITAFAKQKESTTELGDLTHLLIEDAASVFVTEVTRTRINADLLQTVEGLLGEHPQIQNGQLALQLNQFWLRFNAHRLVVVPAFQRLQALRHELIETEKKRLNLEQFHAKPLTTFVRNQLIDQVYLPLIGNNFAKQIGTVGDSNRTDRSGMLLLISPPGYGKTTLMEYVADRLGLIFVRINCPALGHQVVSLDPSQAPSSAAQQELEKLNLALAMGKNVLLYLDDIQHTNSEFLQKFISLADGTRRIEGQFNGEPRSYDLRGKRFAIVMAGNPYTESGEVFRIPDMLTNRADVHNLGDVLSGQEALFALSYIENSVTANSILQPLAAGDPKDVELLVRLAQGEEVASTAFAHPYGAAELDEMTALLKRLFVVRNTLLKVNQAYIDSAAQQDAYRVEPPFRLQGSYRNMTRLAAQITPLQEEAELDQLLRDHYRAEAQTLTTGAEENLLKLAQLLGHPSTEEQERWQEITAEYVRRLKLGGEDDGSMRIASSMLEVATAVDRLQKTDLSPILQSGLQEIRQSLLQTVPDPAGQQAMHEIATQLAEMGEILKKLPQRSAQSEAEAAALNPVPAAVETVSEAIKEGLHQLSYQFAKALAAHRPHIEILPPDNSQLIEIASGMVSTYQKTLMPLALSTYRKIRLDHSMWDELKRLSDLTKQMETQINQNRKST